MTLDEHYVYGIAEAIRVLRPGCVFELYDTNFIKWYDPNGLPAPSWEDIMVQMEKDRLVFESLKYVRDRAKEYPDAKEQVDDLWHQINSGKVIDQSSEWFIRIKEIKQKYPKP